MKKRAGVKIPAPSKLSPSAGKLAQAAHIPSANAGSAAKRPLKILHPR
jgi:hypothetical protein